MIEILKRKNFIRYFFPVLGGIIGGESVSSYLWVLTMPISLAILWQGFSDKTSNFLWGFFFILVSHHWLINLHPLTWLGYKWFVSLLIALTLWSVCSIAGGLLIVLWGLIGNRIFFKDSLLIWSPYQIFIKILLISCLWGLGEFLLSQTSFFWIGIGDSLIPGDIYLSGLSRWLGSSGLCVIQLLIGFWMFLLYERYKNKLPFKKLFFFGFINIILLHSLGAFLISSPQGNIGYSTAIWQTNISISDKLFMSNEEMAEKLIDAQNKAFQKNADLLVLPEGTLRSDFVMSNASILDTLAGGFRLTNGNMRSSLLAFKEGDTNYSSFIDKTRLVPIGEKIPNFISNFSKGLTLINGLQSGENSRYFKFKNKPPLAVAICYEISDSMKIRKAVNKGAQLILSIANLDPYPLTIQKQFISLARMRSIENNRDNLIISNTGPSGLIRNDGKVVNKLNPFEEEIKVLNPKISVKNTFHNKYGEKPLLALLFLLVILNNFSTFKKFK